MNLSKIFKLVSAPEAAKFKYNPANRILNKRHVDDFYDSIRCDYDMLVKYDVPVVFDGVPIYVNPKTMNVLDGQHRLTAFLRAVTGGMIPPNSCIVVMFLECDPDAEILKIQQFNTKAKNWVTGDFVRACMTAGLDSYKKLYDFTSSHSICWNKNTLLYSYAHLFLKGTLGDISIREGQFFVTDEEIALGHTIHEEIVKLREILGITTKNNQLQRMIIVWRRRRDTISVNDVMKASHLFNGANTVSDWENFFQAVAENK